MSRVALKLAAGTSHAVETPRPVTIDETGRVFDPSGDRLFQFEPDRVLKGQRDIRDGNTVSLKELRQGEARKRGVKSRPAPSRCSSHEDCEKE